MSCCTDEKLLAFSCLYGFLVVNVVVVVVVAAAAAAAAAAATAAEAVADVQIYKRLILLD